MSLWGCWAQVPGGRGAGGRDRPLSLLVLLVTRGPVLILSPSMGQTLSGLRVCRWEKASESRFISVLLYLFLCRGLSGSVCPTLRVPVSFLAPICSSTPFSIVHHQLPQPPLTGRKASPSLQTEWTWRVRFPLTGAGRAADCPQPRALREAGVPDRGPLASP